MVRLPVFYIDSESLRLISRICEMYGCKPADAVKGCLMYALRSNRRVSLANFLVAD